MRSLPFRAVCASLSLLLTAGVAVARTAPAQTPAPMPATTKPVTLSATIEAIDKSTRMITLKGPQGNLATVYADSSVKRFDELKVGDTVKATYYESIAVNVRQPGAPAPPSSDGGVSLNPSRPGATGSVQETVTVTVISVDRPNRAVTLKRQDGSIISMRVENQQYPGHGKARRDRGHHLHEGAADRGRARQVGPEAILRRAVGSGREAWAAGGREAVAGSATARLTMRHSLQARPARLVAFR